MVPLGLDAQVSASSLKYIFRPKLRPIVMGRLVTTPIMIVKIPDAKVLQAKTPFEDKPVPTRILELAVKI